MPVRQGQVSGSISTVAFDLPTKVISFWLIPRISSGGLTASMFIVTDNGDRAAIPVNTQILSGAVYVTDIPFIMMPNWYFIIVSNQPLDYYISFDPEK